MSSNTSCGGYGGYMMTKDNTTTFGQVDISTKRRIGTCSLCGGPVSVPAINGLPIKLKATCERCGAVEKEDYGPVIPMARPNEDGWSRKWFGEQWLSRGLTCDMKMSVGERK